MSSRIIVLSSVFLLSFGGVVACGSNATIEASIETPNATSVAELKLVPALDISELGDPAWADRIVIDEIELNIADVRLLGADPRMPTGGLPLLGDPRVVRVDETNRDALDIRIPGYLLDQSDLAVYIRVDRAEALDGASVVVRGRVYEYAVQGLKRALQAAPDPDGDPADDPESTSSEEPLPKCAPDPDGDPAKPTCSRKGLVADAVRSVPFELRDDRIADVIASLDARAVLSVTVGIPAGRWLTASTMAEIDRAFLPTARASTTRDDDDQFSPSETVVLRSTTDEIRSDSGEEAYFASDEVHDDLGDLKVRREHP